MFIKYANEVYLEIKPKNLHNVFILNATLE